MIEGRYHPGINLVDVVSGNSSIAFLCRREWDANKIEEMWSTAHARLANI